MQKWLLIVSFICILIPEGKSQQWRLKRVEAIIGIGTTNVYSDLGGAPNATSLLFIKDITFRTTRPSLYAGLRYKIDPRTTVKASLIYGYSRTEDYEGSRNEGRGFSSITQLVEFSGNFEYYFLPEHRINTSAAMFNRRGMINNYTSFAAYAFIGLGATLYKPELEYQERPNDDYNHDMGITACIPVGLGLKYIISDSWIFGYEIGYRQTFSDFMDGFISPTSKKPDIYWISTFNFSYRIPTNRKGLPMFLDKQWRRTRF